jgi:23S rRNA (uridine2552-2'-O)-methyltransferase
MATNALTRWDSTCSDSMKRNKHNKAWMHEHVTDPWVQKAKEQGYRARAAFKLTEIDDKDRLFRLGQRIVDLGAAPGSWSQVAVQRAGMSATVLAVDLLPMSPLAGVQCFQGDFSDPVLYQQMQEALGGKRVDLVLSDMAPNLSGVASVDQARAIHLCELALSFALETLSTEGGFLVKVFQGEGFMAFRSEMQKSFRTLHVRKPKASRARSSEVYLLGRFPLENRA